MTTTSSAELLILGLLHRERMHGYALTAFLEHRLQFVSSLKKPTAYRMLERLLARGLVEREVERDGRRPERMVYGITPAGRERLLVLLRQQLPHAERFNNPINIPLLFWELLPGSERAELLSERLAHIRAQRAEIASFVDAHSERTSPRLVLEHDLVLLDAEIGWLEQTINELEAEADSLDAPAQAAQP